MSIPHHIFWRFLLLFDAYFLFCQFSFISVLGVYFLSYQVSMFIAVNGNSHSSQYQFSTVIFSHTCVRHFIITNSCFNSLRHYSTFTAHLSLFPRPSVNPFLFSCSSLNDSSLLHLSSFLARLSSLYHCYFPLISLPMLRSRHSHQLSTFIFLHITCRSSQIT